MARVLIIDDDKLFTETCALVLFRAGHRVATAKDGRAGIALLEKEPADLILTDLDMPFGGVRAISTLRKLHPKIPIIVASGAGKTQLATAEILGAYRIIAKPFTPEKLLATMAELLPETPPPPAPGT